MTITSTEFLDAMSEVRYEPTRMKSLIMEHLEAAFDGEVLMVDASMPFPYLMEASTLLTAAAIQRDEILNTRQYPIMALTSEDVFLHQSDADFEGMFATPAGAWFDIYIAKSEVLASAVRVGDTTTKKLTIPKHSQVVVNGAVFTFQYPINLLVKSHGGLDIIYDGSAKSPLQTLRGNKVDWDVVTTAATEDGGGKIPMIRMRVYLKQMRLTSYTYSLGSSKMLKKVLDLTDQFYYARAFSRDGQGNWIEIKTSHSQQVFDPNDPTLLLKVVDNELTVELPYVYYATNLATRDIRVDVYTTKGPMNLSLSGMEIGAFEATWRDLDEDASAIYYAPLEVMSTISVFSTDVVSGGANAPSFAERRARVLNNAVGDSVIPISNAQMGTALAELGFDSMINIDDITNRTFLATRTMPANNNGQVSTGIDAAVITMKIAITDLLNYKTVIDNGERFTVTPDTLYRDIDGVLKIVSDKDREAIDLLRADPLVNTVSDGTYLSTPLHYVLDISEDEFEARPYFLNAPTIDITSYISSNDSLGLTISAGSVRSIVRDNVGYSLRIQSSSNDLWKALTDDQVHVQLAYIPTGESDYAYLNGVQISKAASGERVFEFRLNTNWDIAKDHELTLINFNMYEPIERQYPTALHQDFSLIWSVSDYSVAGGRDVVDVVGKFLLPENTIGVYHETMSVTLGDELSGLWARSRSMVGQRKFLTYGVNVPATRVVNEYETDPETNRPVIEEVDGVKQLKVKYPKGSIIYNADGEIQYKHRVGEAILDENGNPKMESERNILRWWDIVLFDGIYRYATDVNDVVYRSEAPKVLVDWINDSLGSIRSQLLERTEILFQPRNTLKYVECLVEDSDTKILHTAQRLTIDLYVSREVYNDNDLRVALKATTIQQVVAGLDTTVVARITLERAVMNQAGTDLVGIRLSGLGGIENDYNVITLLDESARLCVAKTLIAQVDGSTAVVDAIAVNFKLHAEA